MPLETGPKAILGATDRDTRRCPRCGETFHCGARSDSCWCDEVALSDRARAELRALRLDGCLCRACLESLR
ncbi:MAG TPA: cysteine-rich CWC family protein [Actinomycetota bacterium]|nr:cysteine-rich CWC family protein [Actinomycetota bacterium]